MTVVSYPSGTVIMNVIRPQPENRRCLACSIGYVVSPKDIEYVALIISGHRVKLTYGFYTKADDGGALLVPAKDHELGYGLH